MEYSDALHWRFSKHVAFGAFNECWNWKGASRQSMKNPSYICGVFWYKGTNIKASRMSWFLNRFENAGAMHVLHMCDNPLCVNPAHLFLGTQADNVADTDAKGRRKTVALSGERHARSKLSSDQVNIIKTTSAPMSVLAKEFGVSRKQVGNIRRGAQRRNG